MSQLGSTLMPPLDGLPNVKLHPSGDRFQTRAMVDRMTFGYTAAEGAIYEQLGFERYLSAQLNPATIDDSAVDAYVAANYPGLGFTGSQAVNAASQGDLINQLQRARLYRAIFSKKQLYERIVECFTDHFNIWIRDDVAGILKLVDDRDVVRANAMGTFPNMLRASAHSPAMLAYLNNDTNTKDAPNENYARELMELHSLSVTGGYSQSDVQQVAKCFTGWTYTTGTAANAYTFRYNSSNHDTNQKIVLGSIIPPRAAASGQQDGEDVINILANHPSTRDFVARKLIRHFLQHDPPPSSLVSSVAQVYQATGGSIPAMVTEIFNYAIANPVPMKFKRPMHLLVSSLRALGAQVTATNNLQTPLTEAGHLPFDWNPPDGYPDTLQAWTDLLLARWNFGARLMNGTNGDWWNSTSSTGVRVDHTTIVGTATAKNAIVDAINAKLFNGVLSVPERNQLLAFLPATASTTNIREVLGLAVSLPTFQWY